jgi:GT2 family glycosyltransferase
MRDLFAERRRNLSVRCSIVIPVHGRAGLTRQCIDTILAEPPRVEFEVVVVDDASADDTAEVLRTYESAIRVVARRENGGFARACNDGAETARGDYLAFLNNDTIPGHGWLDALVAVADGDPSIGAVGSKLLFPNDTVQHAGVAICQDGNPRHIYAGFPADHPAVNRARRFQAVTAASMLIRREAFERAGGFDTAFQNCLEDTDLCMRLGELGHAVWYCPDSVVYHLESVSRGRRSREIATAGRLFRERWGDKAERDDLHLYVEDGLLRIRYRDLYPLKIELASELAASADGDLSRFIETQSRQIADLLRETVRLTACVADLDVGDQHELGSTAPGVSRGGTSREQGLAGLAAEADRLQLGIHAFETSVAEAIAQRGWRNGGPAFAVGDRLSYLEQKEQIRAVVDALVPAGATVVVVSRGDDGLVELGDRRGWHFPQEADGTYAGRHPANSDEAIELLERLRDRGASYFVIPEKDVWWLEHYRAFADHLAAHYRPLTRGGASCRMFLLGEARSS